MFGKHWASYDRGRVVTVALLVYHKFTPGGTTLKSEHIDVHAFLARHCFVKQDRSTDL